MNNITEQDISGKKLVNRKIYTIIISNLIIQYFFYFTNSFIIHVYDVTKDGFVSVIKRLLHAFHVDSIIYFIVSGTVGSLIIIKILCPLFSYIKNRNHYLKARRVTIMLPFIMLIMYGLIWIAGSVTSIALAYNSRYNFTALLTEFLCDFSTGLLSAMISIFYVKNSIIDLKRMLKITDIYDNEKDYFARCKGALSYLSLLFFILAHTGYIIYFYYIEGYKLLPEHFYFSIPIVFLVFFCITVILFRMERKEDNRQIALVLDKLKELNDRDDNFSEKLILLNFDNMGRITDRVNKLTNKLMKQRDIMEAKVKERTAELEKVLTMKNELFYMLNHDIKNIFSSIVGAAAVLHYNDLPPKTVNFIKMIERNSQLVLSLTDDFLQMMLSDVDGICTNTKKEDIGIILKNVALTFQDSCDLNGIRLIVKDIPKAVMNVDTEKIYMCFSNLISNAIKFTPPEGFIEIFAEHKSPYIEIHIKDSGIGIPEDHLKTIFEPLKKAHSFGVRGEKGSGLGLSIVKKTIELHGGQIKVKSTVGLGSDFMIKLPLLKTH